MDAIDLNAEIDNGLSAAPPIGAAVAGQFDLNVVKELLAIRDQHETASREARALGEKFDAIERRVIDMLVQSGMQNVTVDGRQVYLRRKLWANIVGEVGEKAIRCLRRIKLGGLVSVKVNPSAISGWVREQVDAKVAEDPTFDPQDPKQLEAVLGAPAKYLQVATKVELSVRKA